LLVRDGKKVLGVDFNPIAVRRWLKGGLDAVYGDASDSEFIASLPLHASTWAVSSVPEQNTTIDHADGRIVLIQTLRKAGFGGKIAVTSHRDSDLDTLRGAGADLVLRPFNNAAHQAVELLELKSPPTRREPSEPEQQRELL
ncbi:MAG TPA: NAD-binding protein, partial [Methyloceanibacter sp.]|nr:NAD-binding protein [Methyloceanibacter sp.]